MIVIVDTDGVPLTVFSNITDAWANHFWGNYNWEERKYSSTPRWDLWSDNGEHQATAWKVEMRVSQ
jgi:hypothetical protein